MAHRLLIYLFTGCLTVIHLQGYAQANLIDKEIQDFALESTDGKMISTTSFSESKGMIVVFSCNHCPFAKLYTSRLNELQKKYAAIKIPLLVINSMDTLIYADERLSLMRKRAKKEKYKFYYLQDAAQEIGKLFGATHTPEAFVVWKVEKKWLIKYAGAIDDNGDSPSSAHSYITTAIDQLLNNKPVTTSVTESLGCRIIYRKH